LQKERRPANCVFAGTYMPQRREKVYYFNVIIYYGYYGVPRGRRGEMRVRV
jgi:hypothetical protein